ncbi:serine hydrolase domain-containing protein [Larkinella rosea]|uniref:Class A beta-lactamase-related serine hydrolase n=1 Tax=Larkinella rosea TaxID=2025312 RepID=A0A3P1BK88_9BACT|nr:serine hydrolase domain-containing protein [Larkinella rosea]RRB00944.1 class A beta-lactamase-related serine hydrolase [Larkinella rosea]
MKISLLILLILTVFLCCTHSVAPEPASKTYDFSSVDRFIDENTAVYQDSIAVLVSQNGNVIYQKEHNLTIDTKRLIASASKWLSGAVIMALVDEKKLALSDSVGKFLPIFTRYGKGNITIRQLFSHTAGFPGDSPEKYEYRRDLTLAQAVDSIAVHTRLTNPPGAVFRYGSASMHVAGRIAELVSGKPWQSLFNEKMAVPCDLRATYLLVNLRNPLIAGGAWTSARDYLNFLEMIVNKGKFRGKRVLSEQVISDMLSDQTRGATIQATPYPANPYSHNPVASVRYGIGNWLDVVDASGKVLESSSPGLFGAHPWQDSKNQVAGIIFTRTTTRQSAVTSLKIREMIRNIIEK